MTSLADRTVAALRATSAELKTLVSTLSDDQLAAPSGADDWTVAQVLSHLGSGAEITLADLQATLRGTPRQDSNEDVWARWNAASPREQADGFVQHDATLIDALETLPAGERESVRVEVGFRPEPLSLATFSGMRLNEAVHHSWDVRVAFDPAASLHGESADVLVEHFADGLGFLLGFVGKADQAPAGTRVAVESAGFALVIDGRVSVSTSTGDSTATFTGQPEAAVRLMSGRLKPPYIPADVEVRGNVTLEDLRRVFPGY